MGGSYNPETAKRWKALKRSQPIPNTVKHGTEHTYNIYKCPCKQCGDAHRAAAKRRPSYNKKQPPKPTEQRTAYERIVRARRVGKPIPDTVAHGTESTYVNWKCHCTPCGDAMSTARNARRKKATHA